MIELHAIVPTGPTFGHALIIFPSKSFLDETGTGKEVAVEAKRLRTVNTESMNILEAKQMKG